MFITYYTLKKNQAAKLKFKKALTTLQKATLPAKAILPAKFDARRQPKTKIRRATRLAQPNYYNLFDWTIQTREVI